MSQFKTIFGPLVFVLTFSITNGWSQDLQDKTGSVTMPGLSGESVFIPLSNRNPATLQPGSDYRGADNSAFPSAVQSYNLPATSGFPPGVAGTQAPSPPNNRFWAPPPEFRDDDDSVNESGEGWSSTPPSNVGWGSVGINTPPMAKENDPRFDYSEPDYTPKSQSIYEDPVEYKKHLSNGSGGYEADYWQDDNKKPGVGSSVWGGEPIVRPKTKKYDPFDYSDDDDEDELPQQKPSKKNLYNTLEPPPKGTYGNQWR
ncbi:MAG: hypothetical protein HQL68_01210 [Magnetococcales bacterium]|nr:hypothetical protein [Magnetococcales bacterium]